jgi:hypothetical protein
MRRRPSFMRVKGETHPVQNDRGLIRGANLSGSPREYAASPLTRFWAKAEDSRADASEAIAQIREQNKAAKKPAAWGLPKLRRSAKP